MDTIKQKILVIEDDQATRELYVEVLTQAGYQVDAAADGEAGLNQAMTGGYSLILLDIMIPKKDGLSVLSSIKSSVNKTKNGPVVIVTNLCGSDIAQEALRFGAVACLVKTSLNPDQLIGKVHDYISA
jgi:DNA-binding response OmpR family regulator